MDAAAFALSSVEKLQRAETLEAVAAQLSTVGGCFGLSHVIIAGIPAPNRSLEPYLMLHSWPEGWYDRYLEHDYFHADPVIRRLRSTALPVAWSEVRYDCEKDKRAHAVMSEAREFRLNAGLSIPVYTPSGGRAAVSFGGSTFELSAADRAALHLIAIYGHARALELKTRANGGTEPKQPNLTAREIEILKWVAAGKTSEVIADILSISRATIETHIANICRKLDSVNRTQAVAEALRAGIIA